MTRKIEIADIAETGTFAVHLAEPAGEPRAAIVVLQEIFGVNAGIRAKCDAYAAQGYLALAPDLFWREAPGFEIDPDADDAVQKGFGQMQKLDETQTVSDIEATIRTARDLVGGGKVGVVGYCFGGRLAYLAAARTDADASVGYYGVGINGLLGEALAIAGPLMLHVPTADHFVGPEAQAAMHAGLDDHPKVTIHDYEGLDHGFATATGARRDEAGAQLADGRTADFFAQHLA